MQDGAEKREGAPGWANAVSEAIADLGGLAGPLLPILHRLMERLGHVPAEAIPVLAQALDLSRAEVHGVVSYYADFRDEPLAERVVRICRGEACQARGGDVLLERARLRTGCREDAARSDDGVFSVVPVDCLGLCSVAPSAQIADRPFGGLTTQRLDELLAAPTPTHPNHADPASHAGSHAVAGVAPAPGVAGAALPRLFLSDDTAARARGAEAVAQALIAATAARGERIELVRTSSRGAHWLEPLLEVETPGGRVGYGPVDVESVDGLLGSGLLRGGAHRLALGPVDAIDFLARQQRVIFRRAGVTAPLSIPDYCALGGLRGLEAALAMAPEAIRAAVLESGLRGRGGAAFPAGIKWNTVAQTPAGQRYLVCNADEGDSGTFADRMLLEGDPYLLIEGMAIAAIAVGASQGFVYVRSEYPAAVQRLEDAIAKAREAGWLGPGVLGSEWPFELEVRVGAGSYVCGEETAMLESLEGRRGIVRAKPPLPAVAGLFGRPTLIQNVLTFASVPGILAGGAAAYRGLGVGRSSGTMPFQLAGNVRRGGLVELPFGVSLRMLVFDFGGGTASGRPVKAIQVGGPLGVYVPESRWDVPLDYERYAEFGAGIGHGGIVVHDDSADLARLARHAMAFCARESCGKCTPCRIGSTRGVEIIDRIRAGTGPEERAAQVALLRDLCTTMVDASLCAMGGMTPLPVLSALEHHPADFGLDGGPRAGSPTHPAAAPTARSGAASEGTRA